MLPLWRIWEAGADRPAIQEQIRNEIRKGTIRVVPAPGGGIRIIPIADPSASREFLRRISA